MRFRVPVEFDASTPDQARELIGRLKNRLGPNGGSEIPAFPQFRWEDPYTEGEDVE